MKKLLIWVSLLSTIAVYGCKGEGSNSSKSAYELDLETLSARSAAHGFPRLGNNTQVSWEGDESNGYIGRNLFDRLHWYQYAVVDSDAVTGDSNPLLPYMGRNGTIRSANPNFVATGYFSPADFVDFDIRWRSLMATYAWDITYDPLTDTDSDTSDGFQKDEWLFKDTSGGYVMLFDFGGGNWSLLQNPNKQGMRQHFVTTYYDLVVSAEVLDGIYHDWGTATAPDLGHPSRDLIDLDGDTISDVDDVTSLSDPVNVEYRTGLKNLYDLGKQTYPSGFLLTANTGWFSEPVYTDRLNGTMLEDFNGAVDSVSLTWGDVMYVYASYLKNGQQPQFTILQVVLPVPGGTPANDNLFYDVMVAQSNVWWTSDDLRIMRFGLASTLMYNGYFNCTNSGAYQAAWWMDEFSVNGSGQSVMPSGPSDTGHIAYIGWLGQPTGEAYKADNPSLTLWSVLKTGKGNTADQSVWRRDFDNGIVIVNPTSNPQTVNLGGSFTRIIGTVDTSTNDGSTSSSIILSSESGLLLLR